MIPETPSQSEKRPMGEFAFLFRGRKTFTSPEQAQQNMQRWMKWFKDLAAQGLLKDPGHPLDSPGKLVKGGDKIVTDGPYAEAKDVVGGYIIVEARDLAHAAELSKGCPILDVGGSVEVRPIQKLNA
jgi:hypothetical protein